MSKSLSEKMVSSKKFPAVVYGLEGIMEIFHVSKSTACRYGQTKIKGACIKNGKKIIIDVKKALQLFGCQNVEELVEQDEG